MVFDTQEIDMLGKTISLSDKFIADYELSRLNEIAQSGSAPLDHPMFLPFIVANQRVLKDSGLFDKLSHLMNLYHNRQYKDVLTEFVSKSCSFKPLDFVAIVGGPKAILPTLSRVSVGNTGVRIGPKIAPITTEELKEIENWISLIESLPSFEDIIGIANREARDHLFHALRVGWLGKILAAHLVLQIPVFELARKKLENLSLKSCCAKTMNGILQYLDGFLYPRLEIMEHALLGGLFHDLAYPLETLPTILKLLTPLGKLQMPPVDDPRVNTVLRRLSLDWCSLLLTEDSLAKYMIYFLWIQHLVREHNLESLEAIMNVDLRLKQTIGEENGALHESLRNEYCKSRKSHAILGALNECLPLILRAAIARHHLINQKVSFGNDPVAFFLILADEIQEWERFTIPELGRRQWLIDDVRLRIECHLPKEVGCTLAEWRASKCVDLQNLQINQEKDINVVISFLPEKNREAINSWPSKGEWETEVVKRFPRICESKWQNIKRLIPMKIEMGNGLSTYYPSLGLSLIGPSGGMYSINLCRNCGKAYRLVHKPDRMSPWFKEGPAHVCKMM